jgi:MoxR-like ATPase
MMELSRVAELGQSIINEVEKAVLGKPALLQQILVTMLAGGHVLLEDYPGLAKTLAANSFATALGLDFKRIQFTPDLLPGDITGSYIHDRQSGRFELRRGPVFANIILADEINRASPKTQSALLEAMQEGQVTLEGETMALPDPFMVIATQNPIEYEGTFPLPEAQLDRFLVKLSMGYPSAEAERAILRGRRERRRDAFDLERVIDAQTILAMRAAMEQIHVEADLESYIVNLVRQTRQDNRIAVGASPRGSLALLKLARAQAALEGRNYILPDDVKHFAKAALSHRMILTPDLWLKPGMSDHIVDMIVQTVPVPVLD